MPTSLSLTSYTFEPTRPSARLRVQTKALPGLHLPSPTTALHIRQRAEGNHAGWPALLFLHYFGGSGRTWEPVMDELACDFRCIAPDLRGFGESEAPGEAPTLYSVGTMACDANHLIEEWELDNFVVIGHAMGGKVALALAAQRPASLKAVVLLAPSPPTPESIDDAKRKRLISSRGDLGEIVETIGRTAAKLLSWPLFQIEVANNLLASAPAWRAWPQCGSREDITSRLAEIEVPVSVAVGAEDSVITRSLVEREIAARLRLPTPIHVFPDTGHLLPLEAPIATADFIREMLTRI